MGLASIFHRFIIPQSGLLLFLISAIIGIFTFDVYGISWDENYQRDIGLVSWNYLFSNDQSLLSFEMRDYGVGFELPLVAIEKIFGFTEVKSIFLMRHLVSHLFFLVGALFAYRLVKQLYNSIPLATIAFLMYVLHPVIYGHSFFNTKDVPFLSLLTICFYLTTMAFQTKSMLHYFVLGLGLGLLINIRIMGSLLLMSVFFFLLIDAFFEKKILFNLKRALLLLCTTILTLIFFWPYLWTDPAGHYLEAFKNMSNFRWDHTNLFKGQQILARDISWNYIPTWFSISTPIPYLVAGLFGILASLFYFFKSPFEYLKDSELRMNLIFLICFILPVLLVILLHSVLYDGWRHLYFIYPSFIFLAVLAIHKLLRLFPKITYTFVSISFLSILIYMFSYFPFQHVYFNYFVTHNQEPNYTRKNYEMDYWGVSFKQGVEYILKHDTASVLKLRCELYPAGNLFILLEPKERERLRFVLPEEADYLLSNYRWHPEDYELNKPKIDSFMVQNYSILDIYKLK